MKLTGGWDGWGTVCKVSPVFAPVSSDVSTVFFTDFMNKFCFFVSLQMMTITMEYSPAMSIQRWAEAPLLPDIHLTLQLLSISEHYLSSTWRDSCHQHPTQTLWQHQPGDTLSLASNDCWEKVPSACLTAAELWWSGFLAHIFLTCPPFGGVAGNKINDVAFSFIAILPSFVKFCFKNLWSTGFKNIEFIGATVGGRIYGKCWREQLEEQVRSLKQANLIGWLPGFAGVSLISSRSTRCRCERQPEGVSTLYLKSIWQGGLYVCRSVKSPKSWFSPVPTRSKLPSDWKYPLQPISDLCGIAFAKILQLWLCWRMTSRCRRFGNTLRKFSQQAKLTYTALIFGVPLSHCMFIEWYVRFSHLKAFARMFHCENINSQL